VSKSTLIAIIIGVVVVILVVGIAVFTKRAPQQYGIAANTGQTTAPAPKVPVTREAAPQNIVVPDQNTKNVPQNVALPDVVTPSSPTSNLRSFEIKAQNDEFTPNTVVVKLNDYTRINITAVDKNYDLTQPDYGIKLAIPKGQTKVLELTVSATGKFTFYCASCGGPTTGPIGYLVVANQK